MSTTNELIAALIEAATIDDFEYPFGSNQIVYDEFNTLVNSITSEQFEAIAQAQPSVLGDILQQIIDTDVYFSYLFIGGILYPIPQIILDPVKTTAISTLVSSAGEYIQSDDLFDSIVSLNEGLGNADAIVDYLSNDKLAEIIADAATIGLNEFSIGQPSVVYSELDILTDVIGSDRIEGVAQENPDLFGNLLQQIVDTDVHFVFFGGGGFGTYLPVLIPAQIKIDAIADFVEAVGDFIPASQLEGAIQTLATVDNFEGVNAVLDNLSDSTLSSLDTSVFESAGVDVGTTSNDFLWDSAGNFEAIYGLGGNDFVVGGSGNTSLYGGDGNDYVYDFGGNDNDIISGGDGSDTLYGAGGADSFMFYQGETGVDTIILFDTAQGDRVNISDFLDQYDPVQDAINDFVTLTESNGSTTVSVDVDGQGAGGSQDVVVLNGVIGLDIEDVIDTSGIV